MSTHNIGFHEEIRKIPAFFGRKKCLICCCVLFQENRKGIEEMVERTLQSFLCVPVTSRSDNNLIALACLVNKTNANR